MEQTSTWKILKGIILSSKKKEQSKDFPGGPTLRHCAPNTRSPGLIPGQGTRSPHAATESYRGATKDITCPN